MSRIAEVEGRAAREPGRADAALATGPAGAVSLIDSLAERRVLVFGSLPPGGRDLDLLARPQEHRALAAGLANAGFLARGNVWVRFENCSATAIELVEAGEWSLLPAELEALYAEALPLPGAEHVVRPAPHHGLLIIARKLARGRGPIDEKHRKRIVDTVLEDPAAWRRARASAPGWACERQLALLERRLGLPAGGAGVRRAAAALRRRASRPRGTLIALSGLDGCGKSSQSQYLEDALTRAGLETAVVWTSVMSQPEAVAAVKRAANRALGAFAALRRARGRASSPPAEIDRANSLRRRSASVSFGWALLQGVVNAIRQRGATMAELRRGKVVICDRYVLDALVQLRYAYGEGRGTRLQTLLLRGIPPRPSLTYFLDLPPELATARKPEYEVDQNAERARLYRELCAEHDALWVDATLAPEEICAQIASEAWRLAS